MTCAGPEQAVTAGPSTAVSPIVERAKKKYRRCTPLFRNDGTDYSNDEELAAKRAQVDLSFLHIRSQAKMPLMFYVT